MRRMKEKSSVLICYHYFAQYRLPIIRELANSGAAEFRYMSDCVSNLDSLKVISPDVTVGSGTFQQLHEPIRNRWLGGHFLWQSGLLSRVWAGKYDTLILLGNLNFLSSWIAAGLARLRGKRVLMWGHGFQRDRRGPIDAIRTLFYRLAHGHLLYGHRARNIMVGRRFSPDSLYVIYNSLDVGRQLNAYSRIERSGELARLRAADSDTIKLVYVGRMQERKRLDLLIEAVEQVRAAGYRVRCRLIGGGVARAGLEEQVARLRLEEEVSFAGEIYDEERLALEIAGADLCVVPAATGLTCIHAMAYGVPALINDDVNDQGPESEAVVEGRTGTHFRKGEATDLADKIVAWVSRDQDRDAVAATCRAMVTGAYNPVVQRRVMEAAIAGEPAQSGDTVPA